MAHTTMIGNQVIHDYSTVIFEGAQGLLLDQDKGFFPHVTRSYTGLNNVLAIAQKTGIKQLEVFYTARSYLTRHGAGPLPFELPAAPYTKISDQTNVNNMYQGSLRFAWFNFDLLEGAIYTDLAQVPNDIKINPHILISCMDQLDDQVKYVLNDKLLTLYKQNFLDKVQTRFHNFNIWQSNGPSRATISMLKSAVSSQIQECA
jgi:adenylosuccinate synthase